MPILETATGSLLLIAGLAYLLGSIPFGILLTRAMGLGDLRQIGSGNIGATNVLRTGNKGAAAGTLLLDALKGTAAVLLARWISGGHDDAMQLAALMALIGHCFPIWLRFKGGKGVATFLGVCFGLNLWLGLCVCAVWLAAVLVTRISSVGALAAAWSLILWVLVLGLGAMMTLSLILTVLIYWRHAGNIARLKAGTEPKVGQKAKA
jgi:glycerol-3-phosphate acyltransferase PlsY